VNEESHVSQKLQVYSAMPKDALIRCEIFIHAELFYNFLPDEFVVRQRVERDQWLNPDAQQFFFKVEDYLKPRRVLITGEQLWRALPSSLPGAQEAKRVCTVGTDLFVPFGGDDRECCWYSVQDAEDCLVGAITHSSTRQFNQNRANVRDWVQQFMKWTTRNPGA
jgi:hypothetical protein